jgi:aminomethyltransferase
MNRLSLRKAMQQHIDRPVAETPFQPRYDALSRLPDWYVWAGYKAARSLGDVEAEYTALRNAAGVFDVTPMNKYRISGREAERFLNYLTVRDVRKLAARRVHYTCWCDDFGHVIDDGTLFRFAADDFRLCCQDKQYDWLTDAAVGFDVDIAVETDDVAALALQGPTSCRILKNLGFSGVEQLKPFELADFPLAGGTVTVSRTGFTGDLGYELWTSNDLALPLWDKLFEAGDLHGIRAVGYDALNQCRIEAGFIVPNADFMTASHVLRADRARMPDEIGLDWLVDPDKPNFNGRRALLSARRESRLRHVLVGLEIEGNVPAEGAIIYHRRKKEAGIVTAGIWSPTAKRNIALASLDRPYGTEIISDLWAEIYALREGRYHKLMKPAKIVEKPFVKLERRTRTPPADF